MIVTPGNPSELARAQRFDLEKNDAEIIDLAERAQGRRFTHLDKDSYPIRSISIQPALEEVAEHGFLRKGMTVIAQIDNPFSNQPVTGSIESITADGRFVRVQGRFYPTHRVTVSHD